MGRLAPLQRGRHSLHRHQSFLRFRPRVLIFFVIFWAIALVSINVYLINSASQTRQDNQDKAEEERNRIRRHQQQQQQKSSVVKEKSLLSDPEANKPDTKSTGNNLNVPKALSNASPEEEEPDVEKHRPKQKDEQQHHVIFSTSCHYIHDWLSYLFFFQAMKLEQPGDVWRIVSGCTFEQEEEMQGLFDSLIQPMSDNFHLHFTPQFGRKNPKEWQSTKYWNKPL